MKQSRRYYICNTEGLTYTGEHFSNEKPKGYRSLGSAIQSADALANWYRFSTFGISVFDQDFNELYCAKEGVRNETLRYDEP